MAEIEIPFREDMALAVIEEEKFCTSRNKPYGVPGDCFTVKWKDRKEICELVGVVQLPLIFVAEILYDLEGFESPTQFIYAWNDIHPRKGWTPEKLVWVHFFQVIFL
jgi:hypothetical protein